MAIRKESHKILLAVLATYLVMSFIPQIGLLNLWKGFGSSKGGGSL